MRKIPKCKDIIAMIDLKYSDNKISKETGSVRRTVKKIRNQIDSMDFERSLIYQMTDEEVYFALFPPKVYEIKKCIPDVSAALSDNSKGHSKKELYDEYVNECGKKGVDSLHYRSFCRRVIREEDRHRISPQEDVKPGEAAITLWIKQPVRFPDEDGTICERKLFIGILPYSQYVFVGLYESDTKDNWITANMDMFEFFGGVPKELIAESTKSSCFKGEIRPQYMEMAGYYNTMINIGGAQFALEEIKSIISNLSDALIDTYFSIEECKQHIVQSLDAYLNEMQGNGETRKMSFEDGEKKCLQNLPVERFVPVVRKDAMVQNNCHIKYENGYYSVPYKYAMTEDRTVQLVISSYKLLVYYQGEKIAEHHRLPAGSHSYVTRREDMPPADQVIKMQWNPERFLSWAGAIGPATKEVIRRILISKPIVQQTYLHCNTILLYAKEYGQTELEAACRYAGLSGKGPAYKRIEDYLKKMYTIKE